MSAEHSLPVSVKMDAANWAYDDEDIAFNRLEVCNYRYLQVLAKQMGLPSNVKKVELIEMIRAKRYCSEKDLEVIVNRVKMERKAKAQMKKEKLKKNLRQGAEVSSTSHSPPITWTPVRPSEYVIQYSSESPPDIMKPNPRPSVVEAGPPFLQKLRSDRVLRSYNAMRRPNYRILDQTDCVVVKSRNTVKEIRHRERFQRIQELRQDRTFRSVNVNMQHQRPDVNALMLRGDRQLVPVISRSINTGPNQVKRQRKLSGIYPLECQENPQYMPTVGFRQTDGRVCKINAVIQRPLASTLLPKNHTFIQKKSLLRRDSTVNVNPNPCVTVQDVINYEVDHPTMDLTCPRAIESNEVHVIDQSNGIDRASYEHRNVNNQQIEPMSKRQIEQPIQDYQSSSKQQYDQNNPNAVKLSYQGRTLVNIVPEKTTKRDQNRKVYINRQSDGRKGWSVEMDQEPRVKGPKSKRSLTDQFLNTSNESTSLCFSHKTREYSNQVPASTNNEVALKIISAPMSREPRFDQEMRDRNMEHTRNAEHARNVDDSRDMDYTRSAEHNTNMEDYSRHVDYARSNNVSCTELARIDHSRNVDPYNNDARNAEHARKTDLRAIEAPRTQTDLQNQYPNMSSLTDVLPNEDYTQRTDMQSQWKTEVYCHKKMRAEQMRCNNVERLPRINEVFSQFNDEAYKKLIQPVYVSEESDRAPIPMTVNVNNVCLLESVYNFKSEFLTNPPLCRFKPPLTTCTYSTKTVPSAVEQSTAAVYNEHCNPYECPSGTVSAHQQHNAYHSSTYVYAQPDGQTDIGCNEVMHSPTATVETQSQASQDLEDIDNITIPSPEMVDDALELISQDGDYMERIGMEARVQCILCSDWAGPKFILEYHIKKEHHHDIHQMSSRTSGVQLSLSRSLGTRAWSSQMLQYLDTLYALSAKREETSLLLAFSAIPNHLEMPRRCRMTVCNKHLDQPLTYESDIKHIPDSMPYEYGQGCFALDLDILEPEKVVGQSDSDSLELAVYIQLFY